MLIRFWCDSDITFSRGLHKNLVTVLYFSVINVLCGAGGDASFAPQANLVYFIFCQLNQSFSKNFFLYTGGDILLYLCPLSLCLSPIHFSPAQSNSKKIKLFFWGGGEIYQINLGRTCFHRFGWKSETNNIF